MWHVYEAMFLLLGALPVIGYHGSKPQFGLVVSWGDESTQDAGERFFSLWERLYRDVDEAITLNELPLISGDENCKKEEHDWPLEYVWDQEWAATMSVLEPIPKDRIGVDVCLKRCRPADFLRWAESRGYDIPEELRPLLEDGGDEQKKGEGLANSNNGSIRQLIEPERKDEWFYVIRDAIREYENEKGATPSKSVLWAKLKESPPADYGVGFDAEKNALTFPEERPLSKKAFYERYNRYFPPLEDNKHDKAR